MRSKKNKEEQVLNWVNNKINSQKKIIEDFQKGNSIISFAEIKMIPRSWIEISKGIFARTREKVDENTIILECKMNSGALLKIHSHSDYSELFKPITGVILDKVENIYMKPGDQHAFLPGIWHTILCLEECFIEITCTKLK